MLTSHLKAARVEVMLEAGKVLSGTKRRDLSVWPCAICASLTKEKRREGRRGGITHGRTSMRFSSTPGKSGMTTSHSYLRPVNEAMVLVRPKPNPIVVVFAARVVSWSRWRVVGDGPKDRRSVFSTVVVVVVGVRNRKAMGEADSNITLTFEWSD